MAEEQITAAAMARELIDRCVKAETMEALSWRRERMLYDAIKSALRAKTHQKGNDILAVALDAYDAMMSASN